MAPTPTDEISTVSALPDQIHGLRRAPLHAGTTHAAAAAPSSTGSAADVLPWLAGTHRRIMMCLPLRRVEVVPLSLPHLIVPSACRPASAHILQGWGMWSSRCPYRLSSSWSEFLATSLSTSLRSNHLLQTTWFSSKSAKKTQTYLTAITSVVDCLKRLYVEELKPLEVTYPFNNFASPLLTNSDFDAKPMVMLFGQYSTGS